MVTSGVLDKTRLFSNLLMVFLLCGNVYFSTEFITSLQKPAVEAEANTVLRLKSGRALKDFINKVLDTKGEISLEDRVMLENDILQIHDPVLTSAWNAFVSSKTTIEGQQNAVKVMVLLVERV